MSRHVDCGACRGYGRDLSASCECPVLTDEDGLRDVVHGRNCAASCPVCSGEGVLYACPSGTLWFCAEMADDCDCPACYAQERAHAAVLAVLVGRTA